MRKCKCGATMLPGSVDGTPLFVCLRGHTEPRGENTHGQAQFPSASIVEPEAYAPAPKRNKYGAKGVHTEDGYFHSGGEYKRWCELKLMQEAGEIRDLTRGKKRVFVHDYIRIGSYTPDFEYSIVRHNYCEGIVEDFKSPATKTTAYKLRKNLMLAFYGIEIKETSR